MESRFIFAILSAILAGINSFAFKISAEKNHNSALVTIYTNAIASIIGVTHFILFPQSLDGLPIVIVLGLLIGIFNVVAVITRIKALKNIDTTLYFPIYKTLGPIIIVLVSLFFFQESLSLLESVGIFLGVTIPLLLIHKSEKTIQKNLYKGLLLLIIGTIFAVIPPALAKIISNYNLSPTLFVTIGFMFSTILTTIYYFGIVKKRNLTNSIKHIKRTGIINGTITYFAMYCFVLSTTGNLGVVYTINSFSILIPIVLSIIIYKEHINLRKTIAIVLSILALGFFK